MPVEVISSAHRPFDCSRGVQPFRLFAVTSERAARTLLLLHIPFVAMLAKQASVSNVRPHFPGSTAPTVTLPQCKRRSVHETIIIEQAGSSRAVQNFRSPADKLEEAQPKAASSQRSAAAGCRLLKA